MKASLGGKQPRTRGYLVALGAASVVVLVLLLFSLSGLNPPSATMSATTTTSASYAVDAPSVIASAVTYLPTGYALGSSQQLDAGAPGLRSGEYAVLSSQTGSVAKMTILVFDSPDSAQTYIGIAVSNAKALSGYADISPVLASYQHYGVCYGYGEDDPDGNGAVATGVCTRGNVYIQIHLVSHSPLATAKKDLASLVWAGYNAV